MRTLSEHFERSAMQATLLDFRSRMGEIQSAISRKERVTVTSHGRPWAVIVAWDDAKPKTPSAREMLAAGMWKNRDDMSNPAEWVASHRKARFQI